MQGAKVRTQGAKVRASISASRYGMQQQHATTTTTTTSDQIGPAQYDAAISATCVRARFVEEMGVLMQVALIAASCCAGPIWSLVVVVVVVACCCCIPYRLAQIVHLHTWWFTLCNLRWWSFIIIYIYIYTHIYISYHIISHHII